MSKNYTRKSFDLKALDVDTTTKSVKVAIAEMESIDRDGDVFLPTAFNKTIAERGPKGTNEIWHLVDHNASIKSALGKFSELYIDGKYLVGVSQYKDTALWQQVFPLYESGDITQHSVGFSTINKEAKSTHNVITEVALWEGSAVLWGANPNTPTLEVAKSIHGETPETLTDKLSRISKALKGGKFDDEALSLLLIEFKQIQASISELEAAKSTSAPAEPSKDTQRDEEAKMLELYTTIINKQILF